MLDFVNYAHLSKNADQIMHWSTHYQLRGVASTLRQLWTAVSSLLGLISMASPARHSKQIGVWRSASKRAMRFMRDMRKIKFYRFQVHENVICLLPYGYVRLLEYLQNYVFLVDFHYFQNDFLKTILGPVHTEMA